VGCEINPVHFATARQRLENELRQGLLPLTHNIELDGEEESRNRVCSVTEGSAT
jgi:hypothetical protein